MIPTLISFDKLASDEQRKIAQQAGRSFETTPRTCNAPAMGIVAATLNSMVGAGWPVRQGIHYMCVGQVELPGTTGYHSTIIEHDIPEDADTLVVFYHYDGCQFADTEVWAAAVFEKGLPTCRVYKTLLEDPVEVEEGLGWSKDEHPLATGDSETQSQAICNAICRQLSGSIAWFTGTSFQSCKEEYLVPGWHYVNRHPNSPCDDQKAADESGVILFKWALAIVFGYRGKVGEEKALGKPLRRQEWDQYLYRIFERLGSSGEGGLDLPRIQDSDIGRDLLEELLNVMQARR